MNFDRCSYPRVRTPGEMSMSAIFFSFPTRHKGGSHKFDLSVFFLVTQKFSCKGVLNRPGFKRLAGLFAVVKIGGFVVLMSRTGYYKV